MQINKIIILIFAILFTFACSEPISPEERNKRAVQSKDDIYIGVVDSSFDPSLFVDGVNLALAEINEHGGPLGRKIKPLFYDDKRYVKIGQDIAKQVVLNPDIVAVVGHRYSGVAIPVSIIYENNGVLFISTGASSPNFTKYGGNFTFRNMPTDNDIGKELAMFAYQKGYKEMAIFYERETTGQQLADIFGEEADKLGIDIVAVRSYFSRQKDFREITSEVAKNYKFDAVFVGGLLPFAGELIKQAREMGINAPLIGSNSMDSIELFSVAGKSADHVAIPTVFNPNLTEKATIDFIKKFQTKYGIMPDTWAAMGYDAIQLLNYAIEKSSSSSPIAMSYALRFLKNWNGVLGSYSFQQHGDITGKKIFFKELYNGRFEMLEYGIKEEINPLFAIEDKTLRLPLEGIVTSLDPGYAQDTAAIELAEQMFLGLTDFNPTSYEATPELAESWTVRDDKIYRFKLRTDVKWSNNKPVTAHDVVWAIQRNINPESKCPSVSMLYTIKNAKAINNGDITDVSQLGVYALDDFTVEFELEHPTPYFLGVSGLPIYRPLPKETIEQYKDAWTDPENIQVNGSYKLVYWNKNTQLILTKNLSYYDAKTVAIPEVRFYIIPDSEVGFVMYNNNELDITGGNFLRLPFAYLNEIKSNPELNKNYSRQTMFATYAYGFNTKRHPTDKVLVRKAICSAVDRQFIIDLVTKSGEIPATTYTQAIFNTGGSQDNIGLHFNPLQAKKWLEEAGYPNGQNFPEIELLYNISKTHSDIAHAVQASLEYYLNIHLKLREEQWENYVKYLFAPSLSSHHMFRFGWLVDYPDPNNILNDLFNPYNSVNYTGWNNQEFVALMAKALDSMDSQVRKTIYRQAEKILCDDEAVIFPLYFESAHYLVNHRVKDWYHMAIGGQHIRNWRLEK